MNIKLKNLILALFIVSLPYTLFASVRSGGTYEIIDDFIGAGGESYTSGGNYQSHGSFPDFDDDWSYSFDDHVESGHIWNINNIPIAIPISPIDNAEVGITTPTFSWVFSEQDDDDQGAFRVSLSTLPDFSKLTEDSGIVSSSNDYWVPAPLTDGETYYWKVMVSDDDWDEWSGWSAISTFTITLDLAPPSQVLDLGAAPTINLHEIQLSFSAPGDDGTSGQLQQGAYYIRFDKRTVTELGGTPQSWWDNAANMNNIESWQPQAPGLAESVTIFEPVNLENDTTYYFAIRAQDDVSKWGAVSNIPSAKTRKLGSLNSIMDLVMQPDNTIDGRIKLEWTSVGGVEYIVKYDVRSKQELGGTAVSWWSSAANTYSQSWVPQGSGEIESLYSLDGLIAGTTYYVSLIAKDEEIESVPYEVWGMVAGDKIPDAPQNLNALLSGNKVKLTWNKNTEPDMNKYLIYRKTDEGPYVQIAEITHSNNDEQIYNDTDISLNTTYLYKLKSVDNNRNESGFSEIEEVFTGIKYPDVRYVKVVGFTDKHITCTWPSVGSSVKGYRFIRATKMNSDNWEDAGFVYSSHTLTYNVPIETTVKYYRIKTVSWGGTRSEGRFALDTSVDINHVFSNSDFSAWIEIPFELAKEMYPELHDGKPMHIMPEKEETDEMLLIFDFKTYIDNKEIKDFMFTHTRKGPKIVLSYKPLQASGAVSPVQAQNEQLAMFWYNGIEWVKLGGISDLSGSFLYTYSRRLGKFGLKFASLADEFTLNSVAPRIFTPEEENWQINGVRFTFENPNFAEVTIKIFDITGAEIRRNLKREGENVMIWDGKNDDDSIVRAGIYIYQIESDGKIINGTIVIAK